MKKLLCFLAVFLVFVSSCSKSEENANKPKNDNNLTPEILLTLEDVKSLISYEPVVSKNITTQKSTITYSSEPIGQGDPIILELYSYNDSRSVADVSNIFKEKMEKRPKAIKVEDLGAEAFIAYPSINLYRDGFLIVITAGSGADETQSELLRKTAKTVVGRLEEYLKKHPTNSDILKK